MFLAVIAFCVFIGCCSCSSQPYVPGDPGAPWTERELYALRGQIGYVLRNSRKALSRVDGGPVSALEGKVDNWESISGADIFERYLNEPNEVPPGINEGGSLQDAVLPNIGKLVRLSFHDCICLLYTSDAADE